MVWSFYKELRAKKQPRVSLTLALFLTFFIQNEQHKYKTWLYSWQRKKALSLHDICNSSYSCNRSVDHNFSSAKQTFSRFLVSSSSTFYKFGLCLLVMTDPSKRYNLSWFLAPLPSVKHISSKPTWLWKTGQIKLSPALLWVSLQKCLIRCPAVCQLLT